MINAITFIAASIVVCWILFRVECYYQHMKRQLRSLEIRELPGEYKIEAAKHIETEVRAWLESDAPMFVIRLGKYSIRMATSRKEAEEDLANIRKHLLGL